MNGVFGMKKLLTLLLSVSMLFVVSGCGAEEKTEATNGNAAAAQDTAKEQPAQTGGTSKNLVVYFSATGNTRTLAGNAAKALSADIYEIVPQQPYTNADLDYNDKSSRTTKEQDDPDARPEIKGDLPDIGNYDTIVIAYPIWWGQAPRIVDTFVEASKPYLTGKKILPICTSASSGAGSSGDILRNLAPNATWKEAKRFETNASADTLKAWFQQQGA